MDTNRMKRRQLFEWEDQPWFPNQWRTYLTDILSWQSGRIYQSALPKLQTWLLRFKVDTVLDVCSGGGGPWPTLLEQLTDPPIVILSDKYPNLQVDFKGITYHSGTIDITQGIPAIGQGITMFTALHHFPPAKLKLVFEHISERNVPFLAFEFTERRPALIQQLWKSPKIALQITKHLPRETSRSLWTYFLPVIPLTYAWDAWVSHLRSYTVEELQALTAEVNSNIYQWEVGQLPVKNTNRQLTYLMGKPLYH